MLDKIIDKSLACQEKILRGELRTLTEFVTHFETIINLKTLSSDALYQELNQQIKALRLQPSQPETKINPITLKPEKVVKKPS